MATPNRALLMFSLALMSLSLLTNASPSASSASSTDFFLSSDGSAANGLKDPELMSALQNTRRGFLRFLSRFGKNYTDAKAFRHRLTIFENNLIKAVERQLADPTAIHGVTRFSDLTQEEFAAQYLGLRGVGGADLPKETAPKLPTDGLPTALDWREKGAVAEVKNQGMCGSCYAFSAVGAVEGAHYLKTGKLVSLSEQQIVDCDHQCDPKVRACDAGCNGGLMNNVFRYLETAGGLQREVDYPYKGVEGKCRFDALKVEATVQKFVQVAVDDNQIAANLNKYGPLAVAINANWMQSYVRGVSCPLLCDPHGLNHGVLLVGYGQHGFSPARLKYKDFWIIKNSWGREWGESGFYRVCRGRDECGVESMVSAVVAVDSQPEGEQQPAVDVE